MITKIKVKFPISKVENQRVQLPGETIWAIPLEGEGNRAIIDEIPLNITFGLGDIVEYDPERDNIVTQVICRGSKTYGGRILREELGKDNPMTAGIPYKEIIGEYFEPFAIKLCFLTDIMFVMSVPLNMSDDRAAQLIRDSPIAFAAYAGL